MPTQNSPSSAASIQPIAPAYQPRSIPSSSSISRPASGQGSPPIAGVGCSSPASSTAERESASWAWIGVARCWMLAILTRPGSGAGSTQTEWGASRRTIRRTTISCSARSLALVSSRWPMWSSTAGSELRLAEPARATVAAPGPRAADQGLGAGADEGRLRRPAAEAEAGREQLPHRPEDGGDVVGGGRAHPDLAGEHDLLDLAGRGSGPPPPPPRPRSRSGGGRSRSRSARAGRGRAAAARRRAAPPGGHRAARRPPRGRPPGHRSRSGSRRSPRSERHSETSGRTSERGRKRGPDRSRPAVVGEGEAAAPDRPGAGRQALLAAGDPVSRQIEARCERRRRSAPGPARPPRGRCRGPRARSRGPAAPSRTSDRSPGATRRRGRRDRRPRPRRSR